MHRQGILAKLESYKPFDDQDAARCQQIIDFVRKTPACFENSSTTGHLTGAAWLLDPSGNRVLLTHHRKLDKWVQLGGHADGDSDLLAVAIREAQEESGIAEIHAVSAEIFDLDIHLSPANCGEPRHRHFDIRFLLRVAGDPEYCVSHESNDLGWFTAGELETLELDAAVRRMANKWAVGWLPEGACSDLNAPPGK